MNGTDTRKRVGRLILVISAIGIMLLGLYLRSGQIKRRAARHKETKRQQRARALVGQVADRPLFVTTATGYQAASIDVVDEFYVAAREAGLDLVEMYRTAEPGTDVHTSLAYLLAMGSPKKYLHALRARGEPAEANEVVLWIHLIRAPKDEYRFPPGLLEPLRKRVMRSNTPPGKWYTARQYFDAGADARGIELAKELLETPSYYGGLAARKLADFQPTRQPAIDYLWNLANSERPWLAREGLMELSYVLGAQDSSEYLAFTVDDSPENIADLRRELQRRMQEQPPKPKPADRTQLSRAKRYCCAAGMLADTTPSAAFSSPSPANSSTDHSGSPSIGVLAWNRGRWLRSRNSST